MYPFAKLFDLRIRAQEQSLEGIYSENLWIDIFPVDGLASKESERLSDWKLSWSVCRRANTNAFGDYASLPPVEERKTHGITAWRL